MADTKTVLQIVKELVLLSTGTVKGRRSKPQQKFRRQPFLEATTFATLQWPCGRRQRAIAIRQLPKLDERDREEQAQRLHHEGKTRCQLVEVFRTK